MLQPNTFHSDQQDALQYAAAWMRWHMDDGMLDDDGPTPPAWADAVAERTARKAGQVLAGLAAHRGALPR